MHVHSQNDNRWCDKHPLAIDRQNINELVRARGALCVCGLCCLAIRRRGGGRVQRRLLFTFSPSQLFAVVRVLCRRCSNGGAYTVHTHTHTHLVLNVAWLDCRRLSSHLFPPLVCEVCAHWSPVAMCVCVLFFRRLRWSLSGSSPAHITLIPDFYFPMQLIYRNLSSSPYSFSLP